MPITPSGPKKSMPATAGADAESVQKSQDESDAYQKVDTYTATAPNITPRPPERLSAGLAIEEKLRNPNWLVRRLAVGAIVGIIPNLDASKRLEYVQKIQERLWDSSRSVRQSAQDALPLAMSHLSESECLEVFLTIEKRLRDSDRKKRSRAVDALSNSISCLAESDRIVLVLKIEELLGDPDWSIYESASKALAKMIPYLKDADKLILVKQIEKRFTDSQGFLQQRGFMPLANLTEHLETSARLPVVVLFELCLEHVADADYHADVLKALGQVIPYLNESEQIKHVYKVEEKLGDLSVFVRKAAVSALKNVSLHLSNDALLGLITIIENRMGDTNAGVRASAVSLLGDIIPLLEDSDRLAHLQKIKELLGDDELYVRQLAVFALEKSLPQLNQQQRLFLINILWSLNNLSYMFFADGGNGFSAWHNWAQTALTTLDPIEHQKLDLASINPVVLPDDHFIGATSYGRSLVKSMVDGALLVYKALKKGQLMGDLLRELAWATRVKDMGLRSEVIEPVGSVNEGGKQGIVFKAPRNYYQYLVDEGVSWGDFKKGLLNAIHDAFLLAKHGLYHTVPIRLFHNAEAGHINRPSGDRGRYTWMPDLVFGYTSRPGMGRLDNWNGAIWYGNYGQSGLRDLEEVAALDEVMNHGEKYAPELRNLKDKPNAPALYDMAILGNHLLAGVLYIGNHLRIIAQSENEQTFWNDDSKLKPFADLLHEMFSLAHSVKNALAEEKAKEIMKDKADWTKLARQLAFFMTKAYVPYVKPGADPANFPKTIYGPETKIIITDSQYRSNSYNEENGWVGPSGQPDQLSLGPVNGQFPIREFEAAAYATFIPWSGVGMGLIH